MDRRTRTLVVIGLAVVLAALASFGVYRAIANRPIQEVAIPHTFVVVAKEGIPVGSLVTKEQVRLAGWPDDSPVAGGFTVDDFTVDEQAGTVTCPAGHTVTLSRTRIATFDVACRDCPLRERCTTCKTGRKLVPHERDDLLRQARADWAASTGLREDYMKHRPNVERVIA